jgi:hypothetical protein
MKPSAGRPGAATTIITQIWEYLTEKRNLVLKSLEIHPKSRFSGFVTKLPHRVTSMQPNVRHALATVPGRGMVRDR